MRVVLCLILQFAVIFSCLGGKVWTQPCQVHPLFCATLQMQSREGAGTVLGRILHPRSAKILKENLLHRLGITKGEQIYLVEVFQVMLESNTEKIESTFKSIMSNQSAEVAKLLQKHQQQTNLHLATHDSMLSELDERLHKLEASGKAWDTAISKVQEEVGKAICTSLYDSLEDEDFTRAINHGIVRVSTDKIIGKEKITVLA